MSNGSWTFYEAVKAELQKFQRPRELLSRFLAKAHDTALKRRRSVDTGAKFKVSCLACQGNSIRGCQGPWSALFD